MAKQTFTNVDRRAVYEAYGGKCHYCRHPLVYGESEIDHVVAESIADDADRLSRLKTDLHLPESFLVTSDENLVLSCGTCNGRKTDFSPSGLIVILEVARRKAHQIKALREKYSKIISADKLILPLIAAYETGTLTRSDYERLEWKYYGGSKLLLNDPLRFSGLQPISRLSRADLEDLWDAPVSMFDDDILVVKMRDDSGYFREISTCRDYVDALRCGYYANSNYDIKLSAHIDRTASILSALRVAEPARESYLREPRVGVCDLRYMGLGNLPFSLDAEEVVEVMATGNFKSLEDLRLAGSLEVVEFSSLSIKFCNMIRTMWEVLRADFNGDGVEELLISIHDAADGGTLGYGYATVLCRVAPEGLLEPMLAPPTDLLAEADN